MLSTHIIVLAQGNQSRLGDYAPVPKCLLRLPGCNSVPILTRTLTQVFKLLGGVGVNVRGPYGEHDGHRNGNRVTVLTWYEVHKHYRTFPVEVPYQDGVLWHFAPDLESLADPGNSSLKGIARYLDLVSRSGRIEMVTSDHVRSAPLHNETWPDRTIVLLGDVVYSWRCLDAMTSRVGESNIVFTGTRDLGPGGGELWGIRWNRSGDTLMRSTLATALAKHPKFEAYQPGQLRNWLWEVDKTLIAGRVCARDWWVPIDDYTMDVDLPEHVPLLAQASEKAAFDDKEHGITW